jgi:O-methyltransferase involved in polyketide biosynthesis
MGKNDFRLGGVQETLMLPLWGRAVETRKKNPLLVDPLAVSIIKSIHYDFNTVEKNIHPLSRAAWIARSIYFDGRISAFLSQYPEASIVNIGCGLDTTYDRVNNGKAIWYELDLPDVIELRRQYIKESENRVFISGFVLDRTWYAQVKNKDRVLLLIAGVIYYFDENTVRQLFNEFSSQFKQATVLLDYSSERGVRIANKKVIEKGGMSQSARLLWGIDNIYEIEKWNSKIRVIENMPMFRIHKKNYPVIKRIGMNISDMMKIMSLAHIEIGV